MTKHMQHSVRPARSGDVAQLSRTLAAAFADDPLFCHLLPPGVRARDERLRRMFVLDGSRSLGRGGLWTTADGDAAAVWFPPDHWRPPPREELPETPARLRTGGRPTAREDLPEPPAWLRMGGRQMRTFMRLRTALQPRHMELPPHWYLLYIGTRPERQGRGLGAALLQAVLARCDAGRVPAYLEAS